MIPQKAWGKPEPRFLLCIQHSFCKVLAVLPGTTQGLSAHPESRDRVSLLPEGVISPPLHTSPLVAVLHPALTARSRREWLNLHREAVVTASPRGSNKAQSEIRDKCNYLMTLLSVAQTMLMILATVPASWRDFQGHQP